MPFIKMIKYGKNVFESILKISNNELMNIAVWNDEAKIFMEEGIQRCRRKTEYFSVLGVFVEPRKQGSSSQGLVGEENKTRKAWALSLAQIIL